MVKKNVSIIQFWYQLKDLKIDYLIFRFQKYKLYYCFFKL